MRYTRLTHTNLRGYLTTSSYSPGEKTPTCAVSSSISIEKEGASMSTQDGTAPKARAGATRSEDARTKVSPVNITLLLTSGVIESDRE